MAAAATVAAASTSPAGMGARIHRLARLCGRMLAALVVRTQPLGQRPRFAWGRHRLVIVVLVVGHGHFAGGAVFGEAVSLVAGDVLDGAWAGAGSCEGAGWPSGCVDGTVAGCEGVDVAGMAGVAD